MKVLIFNGYSVGNRGDGMIVSQMVAMFRRRGCEVRVMSDDPGDAEAYGVPWIPPPVPIWPVRGEAAGARRRRAAGDLALALAGRSPAERSFAWADVCVSAGGGYLYDDGGRGTRFNLLLRVLAIRLARRRRPVVLFSQSIGPFTSDAVRRLVARELRRATAVFVRESTSMDVCRTMGLAAEMYDDAAFSLEPAGDGSRDRTDNVTIGATVLNALPGRDAAAHERYIDAVTTGLAVAARQVQASVKLVSQVSAHDADDDRSTAIAVMDRLRDMGVDAAFEDFGRLSDPEVSARYGQFDVLVASRLHSGILAFCAGTPVIGIDYLPKVRGILVRAGLGAYVQPLDGLDARELADTVLDVLERGDGLREAISARRDELRGSAEAAADRVLALARR